MSMPDEPVVVETGSAPQAVVIWLHGLGADGNDFVPIVAQLGLPDATAVRFVFPHAPMRPVTINLGHVMRAWYDVSAISPDAPEDETGIRESATAIHGLIDAERERGIDTRRIVLAGFSQGGAIALHSGLRYPQSLAGILALSCYLPLATSVPAEVAAANRRVPILMIHGRQDPVVPFGMGLTSYECLRDAGFPIQFSAHDMAHTVIAAELQEIARFLRQRLVVDDSGGSAGR
jgi:phospholipase/carboxylesterase